MNGLARHHKSKKEIISLVLKQKSSPAEIWGFFYLLKIKIMEEIWKDVVGYEGRYLISNTGRLKSILKNKEILLNGIINPGGYLQYTLNWKLKNKCNTYRAHQLVAQAFLGHKSCGFILVVDHINDNKTDNRVENLQIVTHRFNVYKTQGHYSSQYKGVSWNKNKKKWQSNIYINGKVKHLGLFIDENEAHLTYQNALKNIEL